MSHVDIDDHGDWIVFTDEHGEWKAHVFASIASFADDPPDHIMDACIGYLSTRGDREPFPYWLCA